MNIPLVDLKTQYQSIRLDIQREINEVLENAAYICGAKVKRFEEDFARLHNVRYCLGVSSGTDALHLAMWALAIGRGDEVIVPVNTYIATSETVSLTGAKPMFVDCDRDSYNINANLIEQVVTPRTKAIIPVHLYGQSADMEQILDIAQRHSLLVIEDAAQAHLAEYYPEKAGIRNEKSEVGNQKSEVSNRTSQIRNSESDISNPQFPSRGEGKKNGIKVGSMGTVGCFSFYPGKNLGAYGEAGAAVTNDEELYQKMLRLRQHGAVVKYCHDIEGHNYRMEEIQGAVLGVKLKHLGDWTEKRRKNATLYNEMLADVEDVITPKEMEYAKHVYHLYVVQVPERDRVQVALKDAGVETGIHYPIPLGEQPAYAHLGHKPEDFPVSHMLGRRILSLPMFPELSESQIEYVVGSLKKAVKR
jgi:dTDP-4-amino-4,6-dideoxygalactose transaminase